MGELHPVADLPGVLDSVGFLRASWLADLPRPWPRFQDIDPRAFKLPTKDDLVLAISHCWCYGVHPDPCANKTRAIQALVKEATDAHKPRGTTLIFMDFLSVPQRPFREGQLERTPEQERLFATALKIFPLIYLHSDAVLHIDVTPERCPEDGRRYETSLSDLDSAHFVQIGDTVHVAHVSRTTAAIMAFDVVTHIGSTRVQGIADVTAAQQAQRERAQEAELRRGSWSWSPWQCATTCQSDLDEITVTMQRAPYGHWSSLPANMKGWVYLERFASMVKGAMAHQNHEGNVAYGTSDGLNQEIKCGSDLLRSAAQKGQPALKEALGIFWEKLAEKQFTAISFDKAENKGGCGGGVVAADDAPRGAARLLTTHGHHTLDKQLLATSKGERVDRIVVATLMANLVEHLHENWQQVEATQRSRHLRMAVLRGDLLGATELLSLGLSPNEVQDSSGSTHLHLAAKCNDVEMVKLLVAHRGDLAKQDSHGNLPAHSVQLWARESTVATFEATAPSQVLLTTPNGASVTPIQRFISWAISADHSKPFTPAMDYLAEVRKLYPDVGFRHHRPSMSQASSMLYAEVPKHSSIEVLARGKNRPVDVWTPVRTAVVANVVYVGLPTMLPWGSWKPSIEKLASFVCERFGARLFAIHEESYDVAQDISTPEGRCEEVSSIIEALPFEGCFTYVCNAKGGEIGALWRLQPRISGALVINPAGWLSDDFYGTPAFEMLVGGVLGQSKQWYARRHEEGGVGQVVGNFFFTEKLESIAQLKVAYQEACGAAAPEFFTLQQKYPLPLLTPFFKSLQPLPELPVIFVLGSLAPALLQQETCFRLHDNLLMNSVVTYLPDSKQWWELEGEMEIRGVAERLAQMLQMQGKMFDVADLVNQDASTSPSPCETTMSDDEEAN